jgi:hypothetical protein
MTGQSLVIAGIGSQDGNVIAWCSRDLGTTWNGPTTVNDRDKSASEGLFSLTADNDKAVYAVWLDQRDGVSKVAMSCSTDGGATWAANTTVYQAPRGSVCECCQPTVAANADGAVAVMWRNHVGDARDMWLSASRNNGKSFTKAIKLGSGTWNLNACPMDGGGVTMVGKTIQTIWRREETLFASTPENYQEISLGSGKNGTVTIVENTVYRAWQRGDTIVMAIGDKPPTEIGSGSYPHLAASAGGKPPAVLVWEDGSEVKALRIDRP